MGNCLDVLRINPGFTSGTNDADFGNKVIGGCNAEVNQNRSPPTTRRRCLNLNFCWDNDRVTSLTSCQPIEDWKNTIALAPSVQVAIQ
jgi:hypothetical protein